MQLFFRPELQNIRQRLLQQKLHIELKINSKLKNLKNYKSTFQYKKNLFNYFEELKNSSYKNIYYTNKCSVTYNRNGYICFRFISKWYAGGVGETREYGLTYRLKDGKKLGVQDVVAGKKSFCMFWAVYPRRRSWTCLN